MRRAIPFLLIGALVLLSLGAAILGATSKRASLSNPTPSASCRVLTSDQAAALLGGKVQGPPLSPFLSPICVYTRGGSRLVIRMVQLPAVARGIRAIIEGHIPLSCAALSLPTECQVPVLNRIQMLGHEVAWLCTSDDPGTAGLAITLDHGTVIQTSAIHAQNCKVAVLGSMRDVLGSY